MDIVEENRGGGVIKHVRDVTMQVLLKRIVLMAIK